MVDGLNHETVSETTGPLTQVPENSWEATATELDTGWDRGRCQQPQGPTKRTSRATASDENSGPRKRVDARSPMT